MPKRDLRKKRGIGVFTRPLYVFDEQLPSELSDALRFARRRVKVAHVGKKGDGFEFLATKGTRDIDLLDLGGVFFTRDPDFKRAGRHPKRNTCIVVLEGHSYSVTNLLLLISPMVKGIERNRWVYEWLLGRRFRLSRSTLVEIDPSGRPLQSFHLN